MGKESVPDWLRCLAEKGSGLEKEEQNGRGREAQGFQLREKPLFEESEIHEA